MKKPTSPVVYFFRGLNSRGDEILRIGPMGFGTYSHRIINSLSPTTVLNVVGLGRGSVEEMGENAYKFLKNDSLFNSFDRPVHFFGHSMGGLVARYLAHKKDICERIESIVTVGTPHLGLPAAVPNDQGKPMKLIRRIIEADLKDNSQYYQSCRPQNMRQFNQDFPNVDGVFYGSLVGKVRREHLPISLRIIDSEYNQEASDGMVPESSQIWGQHLGTYRLDHLEQIGLCQDFNPLRRLEFNLEFRRFCRKLSDYWSSFS